MKQPIDSVRATACGAKWGARCNDSRGFTLFELLTVIGIVGILAAIAIPSMRTFFQNQRLSSSAAALVSSLNYGRSEAVKEDSPGVQVCASSDGLTCSTTVWSDGWIVLSPANANPLQVVGPLYGQGTSVASPNTLSARTSPGLVAQSSITFVSSGQTTLAAGAGAGTFVIFTLCDSRGTTFAREVEVTPMGSVQAAPTPGFELDGKTAIPSC